MTHLAVWRRGLALTLSLAVGLSTSGTAAAQAATSGTQPPYVFLNEIPTRDRLPLAVRPGSVGDDTPVISRDAFLQAYPVDGMKAYNRIADSNARVCKMARDTIDELLTVDHVFESADQDYAALSEIYTALPAQVKRATAIRRVSEVAGTASLCVLSFGLYCIAAVANAFNSESAGMVNSQLMMANIKLSLANILVTRADIRLSRINVRMTSWWVFILAPKCDYAGYTAASSHP